MTLYFAKGSAQTAISDVELAQHLTEVYAQLGARQRVLVVPPDYTRYHSRAGILTRTTYDHYGASLADVLPALGTHQPMSSAQIADMYAGVPVDLFREHRWRDDVVTVGEVPQAFVQSVTEGVWRKPWPVQMNKLLWEGGHDLIVSIGQVVPHEVMGMANYNKNIFIGTGGKTGINESHFIGAAYGMERMMGKANTPLRQILNEGERLYCQHLPLLYVLTVIGADETGALVTRGLFIGDDPECFEAAAALSVEVNFAVVPEPLEKIVVYLPPDEFHSTWLGNKAIYRTRMAIADGGELIVLAPGVASFGEDATIDTLIRKYGYRTTPEVMSAVEANADLQDNLSAAAHLIHGSTEGRFRVTYCPGGLTRDEIEGVGYGYADLQAMLERYPPDRLRDGWQSPGDEPFFYISNPALGLWASADRLD
ncbi:MAG: lactate racemase domain-containing protein [Pseudomonadales bacterium]